MEKQRPAREGMILAKRIMDKGGSNHILVSEQVVQQIRQLRKDYKFMDMGEHIVKHGQKVKVFSFLFQDENNKIGSTEPIGYAKDVNILTSRLIFH